jgi:hypothetical protein
MYHTVRYWSRTSNRIGMDFTLLKKLKVEIDEYKSSSLRLRSRDQSWSGLRTAVTSRKYQKRNTGWYRTKSTHPKSFSATTPPDYFSDPCMFPDYFMRAIANKSNSHFRIDSSLDYFLDCTKIRHRIRK